MVPGRFRSVQFIALVFALLVVQRNAVAQSFSAHTDFSMGGIGYKTIFADFNGDGKPDVAAPGNRAGSIFLNTTTPGATAPTFSTRVDLSTSMDSRGIAVGDLNGDGLPDVVMVNTLTYYDETYGTTMSIFLNTTTPGATTPTFSSKTDFTTNAYPYDAVVSRVFCGHPDSLLVGIRHTESRSVRSSRLLFIGI